MSNVSFSIKSKLFIAVCLTAAICVSLPLGFAYYLLEADLVADTYNAASEKLELAKRIYLKVESDDIDAKVAAVSNMLGKEVAFVSPDGQTIVPASWSSDGWKLSRSEMTSVQDNGILFQVLKDSVDDSENLYSAIKVNAHPGVDDGYLVTEQSLSVLNARMGTVSNVFFWVLPIVALVCYMVIRFVTPATHNICRINGAYS